MKWWRQADAYFTTTRRPNADMTAKVGEQIKPQHPFAQRFNGMAIANTDFTHHQANGRRRDLADDRFTDTSNGEMQFDGAGYAAGRFTRITDANGDATIILTQMAGCRDAVPSIVPVDY